MKGLWFWLAALGLVTGDTAFGGAIETSVMGSYARSRLSDGYNSVQRRYAGSMDFKFTQISAIQLEYSHTTTKISYKTTLNGILSYYTNYAVTYDDVVYSVNWIQNLVPAKYLIQPYFKVGVGRMNRTQKEEYLGITDSVGQKVITGVGGLGLRVFLTRSMALKGEFVSYMPDARISTWKENQMFSGGLSWVF